MFIEDEDTVRQLTPTQIEIITTALYHYELHLRTAGIPGIARDVEGLRTLLVPFQGKAICLFPRDVSGLLSSL